MAHVTLNDVLLLGAPDGKTEMIDGRVSRVFVAKDAVQARAVFVSLAGEVDAAAGGSGEPKLEPDVSRFAAGRFQLELREVAVWLYCRVSRALWDEFCR